MVLFESMNCVDKLKKDVRDENDVDRVDYKNDPSAGSTTDTVLRLSHSSNITVYKTLGGSWVSPCAILRIIHQNVQSIEATGGVYKGQGRIQSRMLTCIYKVFLVSDKQFQASVPKKIKFATLCRFFRSELTLLLPM